MNQIKLLAFLLILIFSTVRAQNYQNFQWTKDGALIELNQFNYKYRDDKKENFSVRDYYTFTDPAKHGQFKLPYKEVIVALPPNTRPTVKVLAKDENIITGVIPKINPKVNLTRDSVLIYTEVENQNIIYSKNENIVSIQKYFWMRGYYCVLLRINSVIFDADTRKIHQLKSIKIALEFPGGLPAINQRGKKAVSNDSTLTSIILNSRELEPTGIQNVSQVRDSSSQWIDFNSTYIKYSLSSNSIFRITKKDLDDRHLLTGAVDPRTFRLFESGREIPIYVYGADDGSFDDGDYIEFPGGMNFPKISHRVINNDSQEYNEYLNRYTDSLYYFLTWGKSNGKRTPVQKSNPAGTDSLYYYMDTEHFEKNTMLQNLNSDEIADQMPDWKKNKSWYWEWFYTQTSNFAVSLNNVYKGKTANLFFKLVSAGSNVTTKSHNLSMSFNGTKIDTQVVDLNKQVLLNGKIISDKLLEGNNQFTILNADNGTSPNYLAVDWYEIEYPRQLIAINDSLLIKLDANIDTRIRIIKIRNVNAKSPLLYKIKPAVKKIESFQLIGTTLVFTDTTSALDSYLLVPGVRTPNFLYSETIKDLTSKNLSADYIGITHPKFLAASSDYVSNISKLYNLRTTLVDINNIYDCFSFGYPYPEAIRSFLISANLNWQQPKPIYLTIIGDADYDYKRFRFINDGVVGGGDYVPSYGAPVSDNWYGMLDSTVNLPQLMIGRIPVNSTDDLKRYSDKVNANFQSSYTDFNKRYMFFSGGSTPDEIASFKSVNDSVINKLIYPAPVGGIYSIFYKTTSPLSDYGPVSAQQFNQAIDAGALVISYLGHSGTATWDNSINSVSQLKNNVNRNPLIIDFGCSTNKFAEPDIVCFGERFLLDPDGQAICYIGNSSLGFTSTATIAPQVLFGKYSTEPDHSVGALHLETKTGMLSQFGFSDVNKIYALTSTLLGDPAVKIKQPLKPNLHIDENSLITNGSIIYESSDSVMVKYLIKNLGRAGASTYQAKFVQKYGGNIIATRNFTRAMPLYADTLQVWIKTKNYPGEHELDLNLDPQNLIDEIDKTDNTLVSKLNVYSSSLRDNLTYQNEQSIKDSLTILNPTSYGLPQFNILLEIADNSTFANSNIMKVPSSSLYERVSIKTLQNSKRYWFHYKIDDSKSQYSSIKSFFKGDTPVYYLNDSSSFSGQKYSNLNYSGKGVLLSKDTIRLSALSAGFYSGANCSIAQNGRNLLTISFFAGMGIVVFDEKTLKMEYADSFTLFNDPTRMSQLVNYINSIPTGKIVALAVADDAANNITTDLKNAVKSLGSTKIDSLVFRGSWAMIGKKGFTPTDVVEQIKGPYDGLVQIGKSYQTNYSRGRLTTNKIGPSVKWKNIVVSADTTALSRIIYRPVVTEQTGKPDTLNAVKIANGIGDLSGIDAGKYPYIQIVADVNSSDTNLPLLRTLGVNYTKPAELGTNYQVVSVLKDSVYQGDSVILSFYVYNAGESTARKFKVLVEAARSNSSKENIFEVTVDSLGSEQRKLFNVSYPTLNAIGSVAFNITIDPDNSVFELYKDNNFYSVPFYIKPNNKPASIKLTIDGGDVLDGDFISSSPLIRVELSDYSLIPITDTSHVQIYLNSKRITYNDNAVSYSFSNSNPKFVLNYKPKLDDGNYTLKVVGSNANGQVIDSAGVVRKFAVSNNAQLLYVYNYPNPFRSDTYFTFKLTQIPDELKIKIFTVAGRMIKEIIMPPTGLNYDFNRIHWDGRDETGSVVANGVYLYMVIMKKGSRTVQTTQKLAIVR